MAQSGFRIFLSHRYKSPEVNLFFFSYIAEIAEVQFEVDQGLPALNVTRLERMVRDADAFMGIYPFPTEPGPPPSVEELRRQSRYFRLELDLAIRSGKPAFVFYDGRYGTVMRMPFGITMYSFDAREILSSVAAHKIATWKRGFKDFAGKVRALLRPGNFGYATSTSGGQVGLLLPPRDGPLGYAPYHYDLVKSLVEESYETFSLPWPPKIDPTFFREVCQLDWLVLDVGARSALTGAPAYLHGQFVPSMRLLQTTSDAATDAETSPLEETLYGGVEVGYRKDIVRWWDEATLRDTLQQRLAALNWPSRLITTSSQAQKYFSSAALRNEDVFLSYSGEDEEEARVLQRALEGRFNSVFNYRDPAGSPIPAGEQWNAVIYDQVGKRAIGVILLSRSYAASKHCQHEAAVMMERRDSVKAGMRVFPVKLHAKKFESLSVLAGVQYLRWYEYESPHALVDEIVRQLDPPAA